MVIALIKIYLGCQRQSPHLRKPFAALEFRGGILGSVLMINSHWAKALVFGGLFALLGSVTGCPDPDAIGKTVPVTGRCRP